MAEIKFKNLTRAGLLTNIQETVLPSGDRLYKVVFNSSFYFYATLEEALQGAIELGQAQANFYRRDCTEKRKVLAMVAKARRELSMMANEKGK